MKLRDFDFMDVIVWSVAIFIAALCVSGTIFVLREALS